MRIDRRSWLKFITGGALAAGVSREALAEEAPKLPEVTQLALASEAEIAENAGIAFPTYHVSQYSLVNWSIYDRVTIRHGEEFTRGDLFGGAFVDHVGRYKQKTMADTNMWQAYRLPTPQSFRTENIFFLFDPLNDPADNARWRSVAVWSLWIGMKVFAAQPFLMSAAISSLQDVTHPNRYPNGLVPLDTLVFDADLQLVINHEYTFRADFDCCGSAFTPRGETFRVAMFLGGVLARGVQ